VKLSRRVVDVDETDESNKKSNKKNGEVKSSAST